MRQVGSLFTHNKRNRPIGTACRIARELGVGLLEAMKRRELLAGDAELNLSDHGRRIFTNFVIDLISWSERRSHPLEAHRTRWVKRDDGRALSFICDGLREFDTAFTQTTKIPGMFADMELKFIKDRRRDGIEAAKAERAYNTNRQ